MSVANTDYIQATIEIFGFFITIVIAMIFRIITGNKKESEKSLFFVLILSGLALLFDAGWYIYDGNPASRAVIINYLCNLFIFLCNPIIIITIRRFLYFIVDENGGRPNKAFICCVDFCMTIALLIPVSNLFYKWMYYIDSENIYHRMTGWSVYTCFNTLGIILCFVMIIVYRKSISWKRRVTLYIFLMAPFIGIGLQATNLGISFIQIGTAIGSFGILASYLVEWIQKEKNDSDISEDRKRLWIIEGIFLIMILFVSAAIISCVVSINKVSNKNSEQSSRALAFMVSETVYSALSEPINVSRIMAESYAVIEALSQENLEGTVAEENMLEFMKRIKEEYGYQMIFVSSTKTQAYYTYEGLSRYMDVDNDRRDAWYNEFMARNVKYELNIDEDKDNDMSLAVFVNMEVRDKDNNLVGICGVGMSIEELMDILKQYEEAYSLKISLSDMDGIIQVDTSREQIGQKLPIDIIPTKNSDIVYYEKDKIRARMTKYMDDLDWYMVIEDNNPNKLDIMEIILPSIVIYVIGVLLMLGFSIVFCIMEKKRRDQLRRSRLLSDYDRLTGVKNRNAFEAFQNAFSFDSLDGQTVHVLMMDINGLKTVNDKFGHIAGDELIIGTTKCIKDTIGKIAEIYRVGGDEFVAVSYEDDEIIQKKIEELMEATNNWSGDLVNELAISIGLSSSTESPDKSLKELVKIADERMYADKNAYYRRTGKDRRMTW